MLLPVTSYVVFILMGQIVTADFLPATPQITVNPVSILDVQESSPDQKLTATTLQGLVNREEPELYLLLAGWDTFWRDHLVDKKYITIGETLSLDNALTKYADRVKSIILYDPKVSASINIATMMASLEEGIVVAPDMNYELLQSVKTVDMRARWDSNAAAYEWALENLLPKMNQQVIACYHPTACNHHLRDYLVSQKVFHFWVTSPSTPGATADEQQRERVFFENLMKATPPNIPVLGFWYSGVDPGLDEYTGVGLAGKYGKITVVTDWATNLSFLGGCRGDLPEAIQKYKAQLATEPPTLQNDKIYLCFDVVESGDAPSYVQSRQYEVFQDKARGAVPINWSLGPAIFDLAPTIAAYYYEQASPNDYIYMAISGAGYCHPFRGLFSKTHEPEKNWDTYLEKTKRYLNQMQCRDMGLYTDAWKPYVRSDADAIVMRFLKGLENIDSIVLGMGRDDDVDYDSSNYFINNTDTSVIAHIMTRWATDYAQKTREENIAWLVNDIRTHSPKDRPGFMHVMALSWAYTPSDIVRVLEELGDEYVPLTIPQFNALFRSYHSCCAK
jgi:hypothetical protein